MQSWLRAVAQALAVLMALTFTVNVSAQDDKKDEKKEFKPIKEELPESVRKAWDDGRQLRDIKNWAQAKVQFDAVYRASKNPRVLHNIAFCWMRLGHNAQALGAWEKQLANRDKLPDKEIKRAEESIKIVQEFVTTLTFKSNQGGATLSIKGIEIGTTPFLSPIPIDQGPNQIKLTKEGFETVEKTIEVEVGKPVTLEMNMVPAAKMGKVTISVTGAEKAEIFMDGGQLGPAPYTGEVPVGERTFEARAKGYVTAIQKSEIKFGQELSITLALTEELKEGKVRIKTDHSDAVIRIGGEEKGTGSWEGVLPAGGYALEIRKDGYKTYASDISVATDQERVLDVTLEEDMVSHWVYWAVTGVVVTAGAAVATYFVLRPSEEPVVTGTLAPGTVDTGYDVGLTVFSF